MLEGADQMTLHQKLGEVRKRIGYVQKRGYNERNNYTYVTAADIAGTVGDFLAELGVVIIPRLESITYEQPLPCRPNAVRVARVIMAYAFTDVNNREEVTVKVAGEGVDAGDKAPYKAMSGALKYALLQLFLLATGDDPEDERISPAEHSATPGERSSERLIPEEELKQLRRLIEETGTELERVLAYYKVSSLEEINARYLPPRGRTTQAKAGKAKWWRKRSCLELSGRTKTLRNGTAGGYKGLGLAMLR
jgi:hypothetical protein